MLRPLSLAAAARLQLSLIACFAALMTTVSVGGSAWERSCAPVTLNVASSDEKFQLLDNLRGQFNKSSASILPGGCQVRVAIYNVNSGEAEYALENGWTTIPNAPRPDVWSPASSAWVDLLSTSKGNSLLPQNPDDRTLFTSPTVIAMPIDQAKALGWPSAQIDWRTIAALIKSGWDAQPGALGKGWGPFKLAKTNPTISTSGLHALIGTYGAVGVATPDGVQSPPAKAFESQIEAGVVHYAATARDLLQVLGHIDALDGKAATIAYASAIPIEEQELAAYDDPSVRNEMLVPIYPLNETVVADHPFVLLNRPGGQRQSVVAGAAAFYDFVTQHLGEIDKEYFRDKNGQAGALLRARLNSVSGGLANLWNGSSTLPPVSALGPEIQQWNLLRKPARVLILVDTGPAARSKLLNIINRLKHGVSNQQGVQGQSRGFEAQDTVGVLTFASPPEGSTSAPSSSCNGAAAGYVQAPDMAKFTDDVKKNTLAELDRIATSTAGQGDTATLDDALLTAVHWMQSGYDDGAINAVLLVDTAPPKRVSDLTAGCLHDQPPTKFVRVFTIGATSTAHGALDPLAPLATAAQGSSYGPNAAGDFVIKAIANF